MLRMKTTIFVLIGHNAHGYKQWLVKSLVDKKFIRWKLRSVTYWLIIRWNTFEILHFSKLLRKIYHQYGSHTSSVYVTRSSILFICASSPFLKCGGCYSFNHIFWHWIMHINKISFVDFDMHQKEHFAFRVVSCSSGGEYSSFVVLYQD